GNWAPAGTEVSPTISLSTNSPTIVTPRVWQRLCETCLPCGHARPRRRKDTNHAGYPGERRGRPGSISHPAAAQGDQQGRGEARRGGQGRSPGCSADGQGGRRLDQGLDGRTERRRQEA